MGEVAADTLTKKRKKKGRPSLIEVQKRALKQQQLLQSKLDQSKDEVRSNFRNPNSAATQSNRRIVNPIEELEEEDDDERRDKKQRLLHGLNSHDDFELDGDASSISRRKIIGAGSDVTGQKGSKATDILQRVSLVESGPVTPLPDKKLLLFILDRVQKKDTYGVYSDPVDPEELPDYHEIIKNPMDFTTLREKLEAGAYSTLEQFEEDVFLICTNAMEYNSADTVYHRQARAMLELAKKDFADLRQESDGEEPVSQSQQPKVVKRGRPPGSGLKKQLEPLLDRTISESSADAAAHTPGGDSSRLSGAYNLRRTPPSVKINHYSENQSSFLIDWEKEFPPSVVKAVNKYGMKNVDENRRDTYFLNSTCLQEASVCTTLDDGVKQLTPVGLNTEHGYARSLARYAANLGPVAWRLAKRRIETVLPSGTEFGPGWVGEKPEAPPQQQKCLNDLPSENMHSSNESKEIASAARLVNQEIVKSEPLINPESNGLVRGCREVCHKPNQMLDAAFSQQGLLPNAKPESNRFQHDLNAKIVSPNSPVSNLQAGSSQQHPDLALQL
ncbi:unnamed protein product [Eruca vesicaria subsp. sativa]|uniref:Bromo domain-containing protein n=1 Tax=Eruca vesicaria subsp. sativa TaxID=29727 RepID=A0ABC8L771_ERUVS|nr:unnamed protein product [Eruca vesicaria subsp. sativa]